MNRLDLFYSDEVIWDLTNCVPFWSYNTGLAFGVLKTLILFLLPLVLMVVLYTNIVNKLWNSERIKGCIAPQFFTSKGNVILVSREVNHQQSEPGQAETLVLRSITHGSRTQTSSEEGWVPRR